MEKRGGPEIYPAGTGGWLDVGIEGHRKIQG